MVDIVYFWLILHMTIYPFLSVYQCRVKELSNLIWAPSQYVCVTVYHISECLSLHPAHLPLK